MSSTKKCSACKVEKPVEEFSPDRTKRDKLRSYCRECDRRIAREWAQRVKKEIKVVVKEKRCLSCGIVKSREEFTTLRCRKDGLSSYCRKCRKIKMEKAYKKRPVKEPTVEHKICPMCKIDKKQSEFYREPKKKDGLSYECKECRIKRTKDWCKNNPDKYKVLNKNKITRHIKEGKQRIYNKHWADRNPDKLKKYNKGRYKRGGLLRQHHRRMRKNALPFDCTKDDLKDIFLMFDNRCAYCGAEGPLALEHVVPVSRIDVENPGTVRGNLMPLCRACNSSKGVRTIDEYFANEKLVRAEVVKFARGRGMGLYDLLVSLKFKMDLLRR